MKRAPGNSLKSVISRLARLGVWGVALLLLLPAGCGKKAPPVAPQTRPLSAVADLKGVLDKSKVRLNWTHRPDNQYAKTYVILRAQRGLSQAACKDCPMVFQKVGSISVPGAARDQQQSLEFSQNLSSGFAYTFSVRPIHGTGAQGPDSNLVTVAVPEAGGGAGDGHE